MIFAFAKAQGIYKIYAQGKVTIKNYALCIEHLAFKSLAACRGASLPTKACAFASVSPDGFRQWDALPAAPPFGRRTEQKLAVAVLFGRVGRGTEAFSLGTAVPSGGQAFADRLRFSSLCLGKFL